MIAPELKEMFCADLAKPALPPDPDDCIVSLQASIGPKGERGEELFFFTVATPKALQREELPRWGRGMLLVETFSWAIVERAVERLLSQARRESWADVAAALNRELNWECENYKPS
jgi:hypothetical protein